MTLNLPICKPDIIKTFLIELFHDSLDFFNFLISLHCVVVKDFIFT